MKHFSIYLVVLISLAFSHFSFSQSPDDLFFSDTITETWAEVHLTYIGIMNDIDNCVDTLYGGRSYAVDIMDFTFGVNDVYAYVISLVVGFFDTDKALCFTNGISYYSPLGDFDDPDVQALTSDSSGIIYAAGHGLSIYNENTETFTYLGDLPDNMHAGGDLTFRYGRLYLSTQENTLVEVDIDNPMNSQIVMTFPDAIPLIHGLATVNYRCDSVITYAYGRDHGESTIFYELDFETKSLIELCPMNRFISGAATPSELSPPDCLLYADLDADNSSLATFYDFFADTACHAPLPIVDEDVQIYCPPGIDSLHIRLTNSLDAGQEYLSFESNNTVTATGIGTTMLTLIAPALTSTADYEEALRQIRYENDAPIPTYGERQIEVEVFASFYESDIATSHILLSSQAIQLQQDTFNTSCAGENTASLTITGMGGQSPYQFIWPDGSMTDTQSDLSTGNYPVQISDALNCENTVEVVVLEPEALEVAVLANDTLICGEAGVLEAMAVGGTPPYIFEWETGHIGDIYENLTAGTYQLTVSDAENCTATATITLEGSDNVMTHQTEERCASNPLIYNNQTYSSDTSFCHVFLAASGCDSIHCIDLSFLAEVTEEATATICRGETYFLDNQALTTDTLVCLTTTGSNGCDSTFCLTLEVEGSFNPQEALICQGEVFDFNGQLLTEAGIYQDTLLDVMSCDSIIELNLSLEALPIVEIETTGNLCSDTSMELSGGNHTTYLWSTGETTPSISIAQSDVYTLLVQSSNGCTASDSIAVETSDLRIFYSSSPVTCAGEQDGHLWVDSIAGGTPPYLAALDGSVLENVSTFEGLASNTYNLLVEDAEGCQNQIAINISEPEALTLDLGADRFLDIGDHIDLEVHTNATDFNIIWQPSEFLDCDTCARVTIRPTEAIVYEVLLTDGKGCIVSEEISIQVAKDGGVYIPNAFSPNQDGLNDELRIFTNSSVVLIHRFRILDRWGGLVFEMENLPPDDAGLYWDGNIRGQAAPTGVYIYQVELERFDGNMEVMSGDVVLMR